jgi:hypothetical protein
MKKKSIFNRLFIIAMFVVSVNAALHSHWHLIKPQQAAGVLNPLGKINL